MVEREANCGSLGLVIRGMLLTKATENLPSSCIDIFYVVLFYLLKRMLLSVVSFSLSSLYMLPRDLFRDTGRLGLKCW